jgi:uncharacterized membrane protein YoaK (UPF0700 family)
MTGTLTNVAMGLESLMFRTVGHAADVRNRTRKQVLVILLYCGGAVVEGLLALHATWAIGFLPTVLVLLILIAHLKN